METAIALYHGPSVDDQTRKEIDHETENVHAIELFEVRTSIVHFLQAEKTPGKELQRRLVPQTSMKSAEKEKTKTETEKREK